MATKEIKKITFSEMAEAFRKFNEKHTDDDKYITGVIVYKSENWPNQNYSLESRSYGVSSDCKRFKPDMGGNSMYGGNLDGTDQCVRLDWYDWEIDYCYLINED